MSNLLAGSEPKLTATRSQPVAQCEDKSTKKLTSNKQYRTSYTYSCFCEAQTYQMYLASRKISVDYRLSPDTYKYQHSAMFPVRAINLVALTAALAPLASASPASPDDITVTLRTDSAPNSCSNPAPERTLAVLETALNNIYGTP
ncbi:hypothetical protein HWV62_36805 [Athelia sp. TMB]|nr:hypothetical protein HWV62_36805 [Athelia sp. TMB]